MKVARFVLKCVAFGLSVAAVVCAIIAYWDKIMDVFYTITDKIEEKKADKLCDAEFADYADCDL